MPLWQQIAFYPRSVALRLQVAVARQLLRGKFRSYALDQLRIAGHGDDLVRVDFPPDMDAKPRWGYRWPVHPELAALFEAHRETHSSWLQKCLAPATECLSWPEMQNPQRPELPWRTNEFLTPFDMATLFGLLRHVRPERYVEIGSGLSTRVAFQACRSGGFPMEIVSIDPTPRFEVASLCDRIYPQRVESMPTDFFKSITPRTVIFIDGSHRSFPGSDVTVFFLEILPRLPSGTIVHFHDIYLPADYPEYLFKRLWSEQYVLAAYLLGGGRRLQVILPCAHLTAQADIAAGLQRVLGESTAGSSFWVQVL